MNETVKKAKEEHLKDLIDYFDRLMENGHTFWFCAAQDEEYSRPFYYVQIHRTKHMATCTTCYKLLELKNKIRKLQKDIGVEQWPLRYRTENEGFYRLMANNSNEYNPNYKLIRKTA